MASASVVVFLGPTLPLLHARELLQDCSSAHVLPPARKGDVYRVMSSGPTVIVLIDGIFHSTPAVWQRELLAAVDEGVHVVGASSMGALRAAELDAYGMVGHGTVYEWYRDGVITGDDEVALHHAPVELGYRALSEPLVNIRYTLRAAVDVGLVDAAIADELIAEASKHYYPERSFDRLLEGPVLRGLPSREIEAIRGTLTDGRTDIKARDAAGALRLAATLAHRPPNVPRSTHEADALAWLRYERARMTGFERDDGALASGAEVLEAALANFEATRSAHRRLSARAFVLAWALQASVRCPPVELAARVGRMIPFADGDARARWLRANGLTEPAFLRLAGERALADWIVETMKPDADRDGGYRADDHDAAMSSFVVAWARQNGVSHPGMPAESPERALVDWVVARGPAHFGMDWIFELALFDELRISGAAASYAKQVRNA